MPPPEHELVPPAVLPEMVMLAIFRVLKLLKIPPPRLAPPTPVPLAVLPEIMLSERFKVLPLT